MTTEQSESSKISYMRRLVKAAKKSYTLDAANKAINYGIKYERCLDRSIEIVEMVAEMEELKKSIVEWKDYCGASALEKYETSRKLQKSLYEQGASNSYAIYR